MVLSKQEGSTPLPRDAKGKKMHEDTELAGVQGTAGISRRDMLRKSAVIGGAGALMWAAPSITKYRSAAFGSEGTPFFGFSNFGAVLTCPDGTFRVKGDLDDNANTFTWSDEHNSLGGCEDAFGDNFFNDWCSADDANGEDKGLGFSQVDIGGGKIRYRLYVVDPENNDCRFLEGAAASLKEGNCCFEGTVGGWHTDGYTHIDWTGPFETGTPSGTNCVDGNGDAGETPGDRRCATD